MKEGYKAFGLDFKCRDFQFEEDNTYEIEGKIKICENGFHFCETPLDVLRYYPINSLFCKVQAIGDIARDESKSVTSKIKILNQISFSELLASHFEIITKNIKESRLAMFTSGYRSNIITSRDSSHSNTTRDEACAITTGYKSHAITSGNEACAITVENDSHSITSGYRSHAITTGSDAHSNTTGYRSNAITTGYRSHANTNGIKSHAITARDKSHAITSRDRSHSITIGNDAHAITNGNESISCALGRHSKVRAKNGWIVLVNWIEDDESGKWIIKNIHSSKVGGSILGEKIDPNKYYWFENDVLLSEEIK